MHVRLVCNLWRPVEQHAGNKHHLTTNSGHFYVSCALQGAPPRVFRQHKFLPWSAHFRCQGHARIRLVASTQTQLVRLNSRRRQPHDFKRFGDVKRELPWRHRQLQWRNRGFLALDRTSREEVGEKEEAVQSSVIWSIQWVRNSASFFRKDLADTSLLWGAEQ